MLSPRSYRTRLRYNPNYNPKVKFTAKSSEFLYKNAKKNTTLCVIFCIKVVFWWAEIYTRLRRERRRAVKTMDLIIIWVADTPRTNHRECGTSSDHLNHTQKRHTVWYVFFVVE